MITNEEDVVNNPDFWLAVGALILVPLGYKLGKSLMTLSKARPKPALIGVDDQLIREGGLPCLSKENCFG